MNIEAKIKYIGPGRKGSKGNPWTVEEVEEATEWLEEN